MSQDLQSAARHAAELIEQTDALIIAAGAGMGVDSGLPDFRGKEGFWNAYPALREAGIDFLSAASPASFRADAALAWGFYGHRLNLYRQVQPHPGFAWLRIWGERMLHGWTVFTSNVDGQFQKAGFASEQVHECHGSIHHLQCLGPCSDAIWSAQDFVPQVDEIRCRLLNVPPTCSRCGGLARPNILMFGDGAWIADRSTAQEQRQAHWLQSVTRPVVIEIGAGTAVPSVRWFSQRIIHEFGGRLIRINPTEFKVPTPHDIGLPVGAVQGLSAIAAELGSGWCFPSDLA